LFRIGELFLFELEKVDSFLLALVVKDLFGNILLLTSPDGNNLKLKDEKIPLVPLEETAAVVYLTFSLFGFPID
jgi:hypothetical protein